VALLLRFVKGVHFRNEVLYIIWIFFMEILFLKIFKHMYFSEGCWKFGHNDVVVRYTVGYATTNSFCQ